ncbi:AEC family transporter [Acetobacter fallax]|uniref:AEC family transporter n=1 Tax=Acetobacter fallax TaxID=1737473 RepID=A0ABX0KD94_9PROT|nr:hypothetical protein [Acetobacter fallax]NHO37868.1 hypothetical protein [Acetobacter fallax]
MNINILITAIAPVIFIIVLGFAAGVRKDFSIAEAKGFSRLALRYALPVALFLGMARFDRDLLLQRKLPATDALLNISGLVQL